MSSFKKTLSLLIFSVLTALGQDVNYLGFFPTIDHSGVLTEKLSYNSYNFAALKLLGSIEDKSRVFYAYTENGLTYQIFSKLSFSNAYVYERQETFEKNARNEHRLFQQLTYRTPLNPKLELKFRLRFDERFIQNNMTSKFEFSHRLRKLAGLKYDFNQSVYAFLYSEFFFNTTKGAGYQFNENWSALQLGVNLNEKNSIEFGYLYVGWIYNQANDWLHQHYLQTTWVNKLNFKKTKTPNID